MIDLPSALHKLNKVQIKDEYKISYIHHHIKTQGSAYFENCVQKMGAGSINRREKSIFKKRGKKIAPEKKLNVVELILIQIINL